MDQDTIEKAYIRKDNQTTVVCPQCKRTKSLSVEKFRDKKHVVTVHCKCGHNFKLQLEFRQGYRKETALGASYTIDRPGVRDGWVMIVDLSMHGARLEAQILHGMRVGDTGKLIFVLDDRKRSVIERRFRVRSVSESIIGCEFTEDQDYQKDLGFYLLP